MSSFETEVSKMRIVYRNNPDDIERGVEFDAVLEEDHEGNSAITDHAVDVGVDMSDHSRPENRVFTFLASVTNTPIYSPTTHNDGAVGREDVLDVDPAVYVEREGNGIYSASGSRFVQKFTHRNLVYDVWTPSAIVNKGRSKWRPRVLQFNREMNRVQNVFLTLEGLRVKALVCQVNTLLGRYDNMLIQKVSAPVRAAGSNEIEFRIDMRQIRVAEVRTTPNAPRPALIRAQKKKTKGGKGTKEADGDISQKAVDKAEETTRLVSELQQLADG